MRRYDTYTREVLSIPFTQLELPSGSLSRDRPMTPRPPVIPSDTQTFPILPNQLEKYLEQTQQHLNRIPPQVFPASGSAPSPSLDEASVLSPPPETMSTIYAFQASTLGMPPMTVYTRFLTRYLDEMIPRKRGKALIDSGLLERIKLILTFQHNGSTRPDSDSAHGTPYPYGTGGSWDTPPFRRWVRRTFARRQATQAEYERAIDFGLLSPPESSLSGPGVPGHAPSTWLSESMNLVFHQDRPVAVRSRIYRIILRAHWITNHAGRDRTWAMVQGVCSYIPKRLVYDFVAACPTCRIARSGLYGAHGRSRCEMSTLGSIPQGGRQKGLVVERGPLPILSIPPYCTPLEGWIPSVGHSGLHQQYHISISKDPHREIDGRVIADSALDLPLSSANPPPHFDLLPPVVSHLHQTLGHSLQFVLRDQDLQETQQETPIVEPPYPLWAMIQKLIEANGEQGEDVNVLAGSPALRRKGDLLVPPDESIESMGVDVGHGTLAALSE